MLGSMDWIIYTLKCPRTMAVRYVGWTCHTPEYRLCAHMREALNKPPKTYKQRWLFSLISIGLRPIAEAVESGAGDGWQDAERRWIAHYRAQGARLTNGTDGGEGVIGWGTPEERSAIAKNATAGLSPEARKIRSERIRAAMTPEHRNGLADYQKSLTPEERAARARRARAAVAPGQNAARAKLGWARSTPEQRAAAWERLANFKANQTHEERCAAAKKAYAAKTPEQHRRLIAAAEAVRAKFTPERRAAIAQKAHSSRTPEERRASAKKAGLSYTTERRSSAAKQWLATLTPEQRSERSRNIWVNKTPEERKAFAQKGLDKIAQNKLDRKLPGLTAAPMISLPACPIPESIEL
jgi:hypothetical protein